jgi:hypothetical protein
MENPPHLVGQIPPEADPASLGDHINWMSYSHEQLYDMITQAIDLPGATDVSSSWVQLSDTLEHIGKQLSSALNASTDGWKGASADMARESIGSLVTWLHNASDSAVRVSGCLTRQIEAAQTARNAMPKPVTAPQPFEPIEHPGAVHGSTDTSATTNASAKFGSGPSITTSPIRQVSAQQEAHQRAASVMQQYQTSSYDIYRTVPQFTAPTNPTKGPRFGPIKAPSTPPQQQPVVGTPVAVAPVKAPAGEPSETSAPAPEESGGAAGSPEAQPRFASGAENRTGSVGTNAAASADRGVPTERTTSQPVGGAGMGAGGRRGEQDHEHKAPKFLEDDEGIFRVDQSTAPRVIGDGPF